MKRLSFILALLLGLGSATTVLAQGKMDFKDSDGNLLVQVNDEGDAGSITLPGLGAVPSVFTDKIYSMGGELYFNGQKLSTPWSMSGANVFYNSGNVGVGTDSPNSNAVLDIDAAGNDKGVLLPRLTTAQRTAISGLAASEEGLIVYDETTDSFWFWSGSQWNELGAGGGGDNLGNHTATQTLDLANNDVTNGGTVTATAFVGDGSGLTGISGSGDNLGNHTATQALNLNGHWLSGDGDSEGIFVDTDGQIGVGTATPSGGIDIEGGTDGQTMLRFSTDRSWAFQQEGTGSGTHLRLRNVDTGVKRFYIDTDGLTEFRNADGTTSNVKIAHNTGTVTATAFVGDGSGLTGISGDDLGNHTATQTLDLANNNITNGGTVTAAAFVGNGSGLTGITGDNLGDHTATQALNLDGNYLSGDGDNEGVFVDASGNVGIGTAVPATKLEVEGSSATLTVDGRAGGALGEVGAIDIRGARQVSGQSFAKVSFTNFDNNTGAVDYVGAEINAQNPNSADAGDLRFSTNDGSEITERMIIAHDGNVGIGIASPETRLEVNGTVSATAFAFHDGTKLTTAKGVYTVGRGDFVGQAGAGVSTAFTKGRGGSYLRSGQENLIAPVHLPHGATITKVTFYGYDLHTTNIEIALSRSALQSADFATIASHTSSTSSGVFTGTVLTSATVDNSQNDYFILVLLVGGSWHSEGELAVHAVVIEYDMN